MSTILGMDSEIYYLPCGCFLNPDTFDGAGVFQTTPIQTVAYDNSLERQSIARTFGASSDLRSRSRNSFGIN